MKTIAMGLVVGLVIAVSGCERQPAGIVPPDPNAKKPNASGDKIPGDDGTNDTANGDQANQSALKTTIYAQSLEGLGININNLSYKFSYLSVTKTDAIRFVGNQADLTFTGLPANQTGDLVLEIYEGTKLQLKGTKAAVTLAPGAQKIDLKLQFVGSTNPATADLVVTVQIDQTTIPVIPTPTVITPTVVPTVAPTVVPTVAPTVIPTPIVTPTVIPTAVPTVNPSILNWDGLSFKGNDKWDIVPVSSSGN